jgi:molecular chaperone DnaK
VFSTAEDGQHAVTVHVLQGERERATDNKSLGRFDLANIPPAPRGVPQVEVTFDIDANGILNVSAKDKATGKEQSIVVRASSGLSDDEIQRMVKDAEAHADEDRRFRELVDVRNQADGLIHATRKSLGELGEQVGEQEKEEVESAIKALETAVAGDDKAEIEAKMQTLTELTGKLAERAYQKSQGDDGPASGDGGDGGAGTAGADDVVDAEFEEVRDNRQ